MTKGHVYPIDFEEFCSAVSLCCGDLQGILQAGPFGQPVPDIRR